MRTLPLTILGSALLCGCTELTVRHASVGPIEGIPYTLPKKVFMVTVSYELKKCDDSSSPVQLTIGKSVEVKHSLEPDPKDRFYIPYSSLRNWFKDTDITIEAHDNQTLKSVTSTIEDKTGAAITSVVSSVVKIAAFGAVAPAKQGQPAPPSPRCSAVAKALLGELGGLVAKATLTDAEKARIGELRASLTHKESVYWSPVKPTDEAALAKKPFTVEIPIEPAGLTGVGGKWVDGDADAGDLPTILQLAVFEPLQKDAALPPTGFVLRPGPTATLRVCERSCPTFALDAKGAAKVDDGRVLSSGAHVVPQFGSYVSLPLKNRIFEKQTLVITVAGDGAVTKMGLKSNATGAAALENLATQIDALSKARAARDKAEADASAAQQTAKKTHADQVSKENTAIAECLKAQKAVRDAGGTVTGTCQ